MKLLYIDKFDYRNSNLHWLRHFQKALGRKDKIWSYDIRQGNFNDTVNDFKPDHVHLGGSVKSQFIPIDLLEHAKRKYNSRITVYYGDATYSEYHEDLAKVADLIGITNSTHAEKINEAAERKVCSYMKPPTDSNVFKPYKLKKEYDVVFIGNNYGDNSTERTYFLEMVEQKFDLAVFGKRWRNNRGEVYDKSFAKVCSQAKIAIGIFTLFDVSVELKHYFSNRLVNTLASGCFYIAPYTPGMEDIFKYGLHLCWYKSLDELIERIRYYLKHDSEREEIASQGREYVIKHFTYEENVRRFLGESR